MGTWAVDYNLGLYEAVRAFREIGVICEYTLLGPIEPAVRGPRIKWR